MWAYIWGLLTGIIPVKSSQIYNTNFVSKMKNLYKYMYKGEHLELRGFTKGLHGTPLGCYVYMYKVGALKTERFYQGITWYPPWVVCVNV